jgi:ubiquinone/menaquinone biosynthesis C-methylase UbiE
MAKQLQEQTQEHYDKYHFIEGGPQRVAWWKEYLSEFLSDSDLRDRFVADIGSSVGEISRGLIDRGARLCCLDLSMESLRRCRINNPEAYVLHGSALELPFPNESFDCVVSIGVLHHTPNCRKGFAEVARVTAPGGAVVVFLYNYWNIYNVIYNAFKPVRAVVPLDSVPSGMLAMLQPFVKSHLGQTLDDAQLRNLLGDKLWTPQATFHSVAEVRRWGLESGLTLTKTKKFFLGYANVMRFEKAGTKATGRRDLALRCLHCGGRMAQDAGGYSCEKCSRSFSLDNGIIDCLKPQEASLAPGSRASA